MVGGLFVQQAGTGGTGFMVQTQTDLPILDAQGISKRFGAVDALKGASLQVGKGQIVAITTPAGRSGWFPALWFQGLGLRIVARSIDLPRLADTVARAIAAHQRRPRAQQEEIYA